jgi:hypothetical protein
MLEMCFTSLRYFGLEVPSEFVLLLAGRGGGDEGGRLSFAEKLDKDFPPSMIK